MKKAFTILIAVLLIAVSAMPAFAESVNSPTPTKGNYNVNISVGEDIGTVTYDFVSGVDENGNQQIHLHIDLKDGEEFGGWVVDGYVDGDLSKPDTILTISKDAVISVKTKGEESTTVVPEPTKSGSDDSGNKGDNGSKGSSGSSGGKVVDSGSKSPQTGSNDVVTFIAFSALALALASAVVVAKKTSK